MTHKPYIVTVFLDPKPKKTFVFEFSSGDYLAVSETTWQRNTQYNGCKYLLWKTNKSYARSAEKQVPKEKIPFNLETSSVYVEEKENGVPNSELVEILTSEF